MDGRFLTFSKQTQECKDLLLGKSMGGERVACVTPQSLEFEKDKITFRLLPTDAFSFPQKAMAWLKLFRPDMLWISLAPLFVLLLHGYFLKRSIDFPLFLYTFVTLVFLHGCAMLVNEFSDHMRGKEISSLQGQPSVLSTGVIRAYLVQRVAVLFGVGALVFSYPLIENAGLPLFYVALGVAGSILGYSFFGKGLKSYGLGEFAVFICFGPLLTYGLSTAVFHEVGIMELAYGVLLGLLAVQYIQLRNFQSIMRDDLHRVGTFISRLGFDRSKKFLQFSFFLNLCLIWGFNYYYLPEYQNVRLILAIVFALLFIGVGVWCIGKVRGIHSPLSSSLKSLMNVVLCMQGLTHFSFVVVSFVLFGFMSRIPFTTKLEIIGTINKFLRWFQ